MKLAQKLISIQKACITLSSLKHKTFSEEVIKSPKQSIKAPPNRLQYQNIICDTKDDPQGKNPLISLSNKIIMSI
jgi:hypothetical protein